MGIDGFIFVSDLGVLFLGVPSWEIGRFSKKNFFSILVFIEKWCHRKMCGLFPCVPIFKGFIFDQKVLQEWRFKFLIETNPLGSCKTYYIY